MRRSCAYYLATMHEMDDDTRREVLGEVVMDELKVIREYLEYLIPTVDKMSKEVAKISGIETDMKVIKFWIKQHERHHDRLERKLQAQGIL